MPKELPILYLVINVATNEERRKLIFLQAKKLKLNIEIISAITGNDIENMVYGTKYNPVRRLKEYSVHLTPNELGCVESHLRCLNLFLETDYQYCLVLEDDAVIDVEIKEHLYYLIEQFSEWDYISRP